MKAINETQPVHKKKETQKIKITQTGHKHFCE